LAVHPYTAAVEGDVMLTTNDDDDDANSVPSSSSAAATAAAAAVVRMSVCVSPLHALTLVCRFRSTATARENYLRLWLHVK